jgi:predicted N-acetyltransferase YhbS
MGDYLIRRLTNQDQDFYPLMGPFLGSRQVARELSIPAWDDHGKVWYVAIRGTEVCGFVAALPQAKSVVFCSDYVTPEHRETGVYSELSVARMLDYADTSTINATVALAAMEVYTRHGFIPTGKRGRYTAMRREWANG